jgi:DNA repair exonuclease SbcCD ATPase subunit
MKRIVTLIIIVFSTSIMLKAQEQQVAVPYTLADRDRAIRTEARMETLESKVDALDTRIDDLNTRIDDLQQQINRLEDKFDTYFLWGFGLVLMSIFGLIGFIIYDRRTTLAPVENKTERIIKALKEAAEKDPSLREALKKTALW